MPQELKPSLDARLTLFLNAQGEGRWDSVAMLLGDYRRGYSGGAVPFTKAHKNCLLAQMQRFPMVAFDYTIQESPYSSEILSTPIIERWWVLTGEATFRTPAKTTRQKAFITAYRNHDEWFFSPFAVDEALATELRRDDPQKDRKDTVDLPGGPDAPLEVIDLHVFLDSKDAKVRNIQFRLRNKTDRTVTRYGFKISDDNERGSITFGTGAQKDAIEPNGSSREFHESYTLVQYLCEGEPRIRIEIGDVGFADGSEWIAPASARNPAKE